MLFLLQPKPSNCILDGSPLPDANQVKSLVILSHVTTTTVPLITSTELTFKPDGSLLQDANQDKFPPISKLAITTTTQTTHLMDPLETSFKLTGSLLPDAKRVKYLLISKLVTTTTTLIIHSMDPLATSFSSKNKFNSDHQSSALRELTETQFLATMMISLSLTINLSQRTRTDSLQPRSSWVAQRSTILQPQRSEILR